MWRPPLLSWVVCRVAPADVAVATISVSLCALVLIALRSMDRFHDAEHFYRRKSPVLFHAMRLCYAILFAAMFWNARFVVMSALVVA